MDFDSDAVVATFQPNQETAIVRIPIVCDTDVEGNERFNLTLTTSPPVMLGARNTAIGVIQDSTGMCIVNGCNLLRCCISRCFLWDIKLQLF